MAVIRLIFVLLATTAGVNGSSFKGTDKKSNHDSCKSLEETADAVHAAYQKMFSGVQGSCDKYIDEVAKYYSSDLVVFHPGGETVENGKVHLVSVQLSGCLVGNPNPESRVFLDEYENSDKKFRCDGKLGVMNGYVSTVLPPPPGPLSPTPPPLVAAVHRFSYDWEKNESGDWKIFFIQDSYST